MTASMITYGIAINSIPLLNEVFLLYSFHRTKKTICHVQKGLCFTIGGIGRFLKWWNAWRKRDFLMFKVYWEEEDEVGEGSG